MAGGALSRAGSKRGIDRRRVGFQLPARSPRRGRRAAHAPPKGGKPARRWPRGRERCRWKNGDGWDVGDDGFSWEKWQVGRIQDDGVELASPSGVGSQIIAEMLCKRYGV